MTKPFKIISVVRDVDKVTVTYQAQHWDGGHDADTPSRYVTGNHTAIRYACGRWNNVSRNVSYFAKLEDAACRK